MVFKRLWNFFSCPFVVEIFLVDFCGLNLRNLEKFEIHQVSIDIIDV